jgi:hypothetical protein
VNDLLVHHNVIEVIPWSWPNYWIASALPQMALAQREAQRSKSSVLCQKQIFQFAPQIRTALESHPALPPTAGSLAAAIWTMRRTVFACVIAMTRGLCWLPAQCFCRFRCWRPGSWCCWFSSGITAHSGASGVAGAGIAASADGRIHPRGRSPERVVVCGAAPLGVRTMVRDRMLVPVRTPPRSRITTLRREGATITQIRQPRLQPWP